MSSRNKRKRGSCSGVRAGDSSIVYGVGSIIPSAEGQSSFSDESFNAFSSPLFVDNSVNDRVDNVQPSSSVPLSVDWAGEHVGLFRHSQASTAVLDNDGVSSLYRDLGDCNHLCNHCSATFWFDERVKAYSSDRCLRFHKCCEDGRVVLPREEEPPTIFKYMLTSKNFMENIRAYNQMFSMTSYGAKIDDTINNSRGPYVFRIPGQVYHWMGSMCPVEGDNPRFLQLYIYDTVNELRNRMTHFGGKSGSNLDPEIVRQLISMLDEHNELVRLFRVVRDKMNDTAIPDFSVRLFSVVGNKQYELPISNSVGAIVYEEGNRSATDYDMIVELKGGTPQRVNKLHRLYMSLQFPLLFVYGQPGYHPELKLRATGRSHRGRSKRMTMNMFYSYQLRNRFNVYSSLLRSGRLFQQYIVTAYCSIELERIEYIRRKQQDIRNEYLSGLYDAINKGDHSGADVGSRTILPASFTGGPRYMYSHYLDALAICRVHKILSSF